MNKRFGIMGYGVIGKATHLSLLQNQQIDKHDPLLGSSLDDLAESTHVFICIPVIGPEGIQYLFDEIDKLKSINRTCKLIIRSTVPVGTCRDLQRHLGETIIYIPEFLRDRFWEIDSLRKPIIVAGDEDAEFDIFPETDIKRCSLEEAEIVKMFSNNISTMKIVFANHFYDLCNNSDVDYQSVLDSFDHVQHRDQTYLDMREDLRGFGGKCLPKDLDFLIETFQKFGIEQQLFTAIRADNGKWPTTVRKS